MTSKECRRLIEMWKQEGTFDSFLPEVAALRGIPQPEQYHGEGDAHVHTMLALSHVDDDSDPRVFWGVLLHDIGKAPTTRWVRGDWRSYGHASAGASMVRPIMERVGFSELGPDVAWLVREHLFHFSWDIDPDQHLNKQQRRFMEHPLFPLLLQVCLADSLGAVGKGDKTRKIRLIGELYSEQILGEKGEF